jgi:hypothetical protein
MPTQDKAMTSSRSSASVIDRPAWRVLLALLIALGALAAPASAEARKRIVVLEIKGPGGEGIARQLDALVERRHTTVTSDRFARTARELRAAQPTDENIARVARDLAIDGVVVGEILERDDSYRLTVQLREGRTGKFVQTIAVRLEEPELSRAAARQIWRMLMPAIDNLPPVAIVEVDRGGAAGGGGRAGQRTPPPPDDLDVAAPPEPQPDRAPEPEPQPDRAPQPEPRHGEDAENPLAPRSAEPLPAPAPPSEPGLSPVELYAGLSVTSRALSFTYEPNISDPPQGYAGAVVPSALLRAELYPLAFAGDDALSGLGVTVLVDHVLRIDSEVRHQGVSTSLPTSQSRLSAGLAYRLALGDRDGGLTLKGSLQYSRLAFHIDRTPSPIDIDVPNVAYAYLDPGLWAGYDLGKIGIFGELRTMLVLSTGEIQQIDHYGTARVLGLDLDVGIDYEFADNLHARGGFRYTGISHAFSGDGQLTDRGGPAAIDVVGAHDRYAGGYVQVGYTF